jgi:hypothetical protein
MTGSAYCATGARELAEYAPLFRPTNSSLSYESWRALHASFLGMYLPMTHLYLCKVQA